MKKSKIIAIALFILLGTTTFTYAASSEAGNELKEVNLENSQRKENENDDFYDNNIIEDNELEENNINIVQLPNLGVVNQDNNLNDVTNDNDVDNDIIDDSNELNDDVTNDNEEELYSEELEDTTAPIFVGFQNGHRYNFKEEGSWTVEDENLESINIYNYIDSSEINTTNNVLDLEEGYYRIIASDNNQNTSKAYVMYDKTLPNIKGFSDNEKSNKNEKVKIEDMTLSKIYVNDVEQVIPEITTAKKYTNKFRINLKEDGVYVIKAVDLVGNEKTKTVTIDKTAPSIKLLSNKLSKNPQFEVTDANNFSVVVKDSMGNIVRDKGTEKYFGIGYLKDGNYTVEATDELGNTSTEKVTVDNTAPTIKIINSELSKNPKFELTDTNDFSVVVKDSMGNIVRDKGTEKYFGIGYLKDGSYTVEATDVAGNVSSQKVTVDNTAPTISILNADDKNPKAHIVDAHNFTVVVKNNSGKIIRDKGMEKYFDIGYLKNGNYIFELTDELGNVSTEKITIKK